MSHVSRGRCACGATIALSVSYGTSSGGTFAYQLGKTYEKITGIEVNDDYGCFVTGMAMGAGIGIKGGAGLMIKRYPELMKPLSLKEFGLDEKNTIPKGQSGLMVEFTLSNLVVQVGMFQRQPVETAKEKVIPAYNACYCDKDMETGEVSKYMKTNNQNKEDTTVYNCKPDGDNPEFCWITGEMMRKCEAVGVETHRSLSTFIFSTEICRLPWLYQQYHPCGRTCVLEYDLEQQGLDSPHAQ